MSVSNDRERNEPKRIAIVLDGEISAAEQINCPMAVDLRREMKLPIEEARIGIDQDLLRIEAPTFFRSPRSVDSIAVALADFDSCEVAMPDRSLTIGE